MKRLPLILNIYLIKNFLKQILYVSASISLLIFVINLFEIFNKINKIKDGYLISATQTLTMASLQVPAFLADIAIFVIMISAMITLFTLSSKSEITVMRSFGLSLWRILAPIMMSAFVVGLVFIFVFLPLTILANKKHTQMRQELIKKVEVGSFAPKNGIWLKQDNLEIVGEEIKIRADRIYKNNLRLEGVTVLFSSVDNVFYRRVDAKGMVLSEGKWHLDSVVINDSENVNKEADGLDIATDLDPEFIVQKIINNFEDVKLFSILSLPKLINNLEFSGFSSRKFRVYFHTLLTQPFLFMGMVLIAAYFSINSNRNRNSAIYVLAGVIFGLVTYISFNIVNALGSSGLLPSFVVTWLVTMTFVSTGALLVFRKESLD
jgi:lipopolysaccharide export system permease protein